MVAGLGEIAVERGLEAVEIPFVQAQRNRPARLFLESLGASFSGGVFRLSAADAAGVSYRPSAGNPSLTVRAPIRAATVRERSSGAPAYSALGTDALVPLPGQWVQHPAGGGQADEGVGRGPGGPPHQNRADYARMATDLRTPEQIFAALRVTPRRRASLRDIDAPRTQLERDLVALWAELLNLEAVGIHENFFEVGGHSLLAVQLLSRVRQIYGVDLSLEVVYSGEFTVAELAKAIELKEIEQAGGDYGELIAELDRLSDADVRALLAEEQDAT